MYQSFMTSLRAAIEAAPYEHAKITAVGIGTLNATGLAERLEMALRRSDCARQVADHNA